jgi:hypothetical protein
MRYTEEELRTVISSSFSYGEALRRLGYTVSGVSHKTLQRNAESMNIDTSHFDTHKKVNRKTPWSLEEIYTTYGMVLTSGAKKLIRNALGDICNCGQGSEWQGKPLTLQIDHINGDHRDHRRENLRMLCPNCHTQTETHSGKNLKLPPKLCRDCGTIVRRKSIQCAPCVKSQRKKIRDEIKRNKALKKEQNAVNWPSDSELQKMVWNMTRVQLGKILGVSDSYISRRCKKLGISVPPAGYFLRKEIKDGNKNIAKSIT